ncbi:transposase [Streptomyces sp. NBC_00178]
MTVVGLLDNVTGWGLKAPVVVADAGYGVSTPFRHGLEERGLSYVLAHFQAVTSGLYPREPSSATAAVSASGTVCTMPSLPASRARACVQSRSPAPKPRPNLGLSRTGRSAS